MNTPTKGDTDELTQLEKGIVSETDPTQFIDLLAAQHYFAGHLGNKIPVESARTMFDIWLTRYASQREIEGRIAELDVLFDRKPNQLSMTLRGNGIAITHYFNSKTIEAFDKHRDELKKQKENV